MSVSQYQYFLCLQALLAYKLCIHVLTRQQFPQPLRSSKHSSLNCDIIIGIYKHGGITNHQLLAILSDTVLCVGKTPRGKGIFFFLRLNPLRDVIIFVSSSRGQRKGRGRWRFRFDFRDNQLYC